MDLIPASPGREKRVRLDSCSNASSPTQLGLLLQSFVELVTFAITICSCEIRQIYCNIVKRQISSGTNDCNSIITLQFSMAIIQPKLFHYGLIKIRKNPSKKRPQVEFRQGYTGNPPIISPFDFWSLEYDAVIMYGVTWGVTSCSQIWLSG